MQKLLKSLCVFLLICAPAFAAEQEDPHYIKPERISPELLSPPAKQGTPAWSLEVMMTKQAQKIITASDKTEMAAQQHASVEMVSDVLGKEFNAEAYPKTFEMLHHVFVDTAAVTDIAKEYWSIPRPYIAAPKQIKLMVEPLSNNSYPSGHTSISFVLAEILGQLMPEHRTELRARAESVALHRIQAGVHYPQDIFAGKRLAAIMLGAFMQNDDFQDDLKAAKEEILNHGKE